MSETGETPPQYEVVKNPAVEGARKAVRGALETNEAWRKYRDSLHVRLEGKSVYRAWVDAADRVVGAMTEADQNALSTKLYGLKRRVLAGGYHVSSAALDTAFNVVTWVPRKIMMIGGLFFGPLAVPAVAVALESAARKGPTAMWMKASAERYARRKIWRYKMAESKEALKNVGGFVGEKVKQMVTGFAYPEGKPVQPPPAKV